MQELAPQVRRASVEEKGEFSLPSKTRTPPGLSKQPERSEDELTLYTVPVRLTYPGAGGPGFNIWHCRTTGEDVPSTADLDALTDILHTFYSAISPFYTPGTTAAFEGVATTIEENPRFDASGSSWSVTGSSSVSVMLPTAAQICIGWTTEEAGRRGRGRTFIGPLTSAVLDGSGDGTPLNGSLTTLRAAADALVSSSMGFANGAWGVYSPSFGIFHDFTGSRIRDTFAVLTSRRD